MWPRNERFSPIYCSSCEHIPRVVHTQRICNREFKYVTRYQERIEKIRKQTKFVINTNRLFQPGIGGNASESNTRVVLWICRFDSEEMGISMSISSSPSLSYLVQAIPSHPPQLASSMQSCPSRHFNAPDTYILTNVFKSNIILFQST